MYDMLLATFLVFQYHLPFHLLIKCDDMGRGWDGVGGWETSSRTAADEHSASRLVSSRLVSGRRGRGGCWETEMAPIGRGTRIHTMHDHSQRDVVSVRIRTVKGYRVRAICERRS